jgi:hypothetical protein
MTSPHQQFEQGLGTIRSALGTALNQKGVHNASISYSIPGLAPLVPEAVRALVHHLPIELSGSPGDDGRARHCRIALDDSSLGESLDETYINILGKWNFLYHLALRLLRREDPKWRYVEVRSNQQYLNNLIEQDHRAITRRSAAMVGGFKSFGSAAITLAGIELAHRIRKRQFSFGRGRYQNFGSLRQIWDRALA